VTRISQVDQVLLLLRERLQRIDRSRTSRSGRGDAARPATSGPLARLQALAALDELGEDDLRRTMVRALLAEELGDTIANDPGFQAIVEDVYRIIGMSDEGRDLIDRAARQLRSEE
jgi:hypothetical protein